MNARLRRRHRSISIAAAVVAPALLFLADTLRKPVAETVGLVAPYLCYMRQDKAFQPGEAVSQQIIGRFLAGPGGRYITGQTVTVDGGMVM